MPTNYGMLPTGHPLDWVINAVPTEASVIMIAAILSASQQYYATHTKAALALEWVGKTLLARLGEDCYMQVSQELGRTNKNPPASVMPTEGRKGKEGSDDIKRGAK